MTRDRASVEPSTDHSLSHSHPLPVPFIPRCSPRLFLYSSEVAGRWEQPGVVRSPKVLSVADFVAMCVVETSASQNPKHGSDEKDEAEDQCRERHIDRHSLGRRARLDVLPC